MTGCHAVVLLSVWFGQHACSSDTQAGNCRTTTVTLAFFHFKPACARVCHPEASGHDSIYSVYFTRMSGLDNTVLTMQPDTCTGKCCNNLGWGSTTRAAHLHWTDQRQSMLASCIPHGRIPTKFSTCAQTGSSLQDRKPVSFHTQLSFGVSSRSSYDVQHLLFPGSLSRRRCHAWLCMALHR